MMPAHCSLETAITAVSTCRRPAAAMDPGAFHRGLMTVVGQSTASDGHRSAIYSESIDEVEASERPPIERRARFSAVPSPGSGSGGTLPDQR